MATGKKFGAYTELATTPAAADKFVCIDVDDTTHGASGTTKYVTRANLVGGLGGVVAKEIGLAVSNEASDLVVGEAKLTFRMPYAMTLTAIKASVTTAPTGAGITVDINDGASSIFSTLLTIAAGSKTSVGGTASVISDTALADDAEITVDITTIGSTVPGTGLKIWLIGTLT